MKTQLSEQTKKYKKIKNWLTFFSLILLFGPILYYLTCAAVATALAGSTTVMVAKVSIFSSSVIIFGILTIVAAVRRTVFKSSIWVLVIALYLLLDYMMWAVVIVGTCQIIDELIFSPLIAHYKNLITINKEIDKRESANK